MIMPNADIAVPKLMVLVADLCVARGEAPVNQYENCWVCKIDDHWTIAVNGHKEPKEFRCHSLQPYEVYVEFNGWPAGLFDPSGGGIAAGTLANEDTLCDALRAAIQRAEQ